MDSKQQTIIRDIFEIMYEYYHNIKEYKHDIWDMTVWYNEYINNQSTLFDCPCIHYSKNYLNDIPRNTLFDKVIENLCEIMIDSCYNLDNCYLDDIVRWYNRGCNLEDFPFIESSDNSEDE